MSQIDWKSLPFGYFKTDYNVRAYYKDGKWSDLEVRDDEMINLHMAATCLHYGQEAFEGMKAFRGKDGKIRLFRPDENAKRLVLSANGILMQPVPTDLFIEACKKVVILNEKFVPPYGEGASFYLRPLLIGSGAEVGVKPAKEYMFIVFGGPVGPYFKSGFKPVPMQIVKDYDRVAPLGTGLFKVGGNYAASLRASERAHEEGYSTVLFLDSKQHKYIDEAGPANFFAIKGNKYITPDSNSILRSITNMSLQQIAKDMGLEVECRPMLLEELNDVDEAAECGTAAVAAPISEVDDIDEGKKYVIAKDGQPGPVTTMLYNRLRAIQLGDEPDTHNWVTVL